MIKNFLKRITGRSFHGGPDAYGRFNYKVLLDKDLLAFCIPCTSPMAFPRCFLTKRPAGLSYIPISGSSIVLSV